MGGGSEAEDRIQSLDVVRGVAVMGILAMNIVPFALPAAVAVNPRAHGMDGPADMVAWVIGFIFIEGKMRGLFSFLFGASMLLVIDRAEAAGQSPASVHFRRMAWLLVFGLLHFYLIWSGDILTSYAAIGMFAFTFRTMEPPRLIVLAIVLLAVQFAIFAAIAAGLSEAAARAAAPDASASAVQLWRSMTEGFGLDPAEIASDVALHRGGYGGILQDRLLELGTWPLLMLFFYGAETLAYFLLGMAALKSGFLTGAWSQASYKKVAIASFAVTVPAYAAMAYLLLAGGFRADRVYAIQFAATVPFRPIMVAGFAALVILVARQGGALMSRIAAAGRAAFTNYLGASIVMTSLFYGYGLGLYGTIGRAELWLVVLAAWAVMLSWSPWWLQRYRHGPFEWLWRSLARSEIQRMRRESRGLSPP